MESFISWTLFIILISAGIYSVFWNMNQEKIVAEKKQREEYLRGNEERVLVENTQKIMDIVGDLQNRWSSFALESSPEFMNPEFPFRDTLSFSGPAISTGIGFYAEYGFVVVRDDHIYYFSLRENGFPNVILPGIENFGKYSSIKTLEAAKELYSRAKNSTWNYTKVKISRDINFNYSEKITEVSHNFIIGSGDLTAISKSNHVGISIGHAGFGTSAGTISGKLSTASVGSEFSEKIVEYIKISVSDSIDSFEIKIPFWDLSRPEIKRIVGNNVMWGACLPYRKSVDEIVDEVRASANRLSDIIAKLKILDVKHDSNGQKECRFCGELILDKAIKCKHCQSMLN